MSTVTTKKRKAFHDDAPQACDQAPVIPTDIIFDLILPFLQDRTTWNSVSSANKELYKAGMERTPPWPETKVDLGQDQGFWPRICLKFSPCGSFLASGAYSGDSSLVSICDRRGKITHLAGHTFSVVDLSFSKDGKYLASSGMDKSIRIWPTNSTTGLPQESGDKTLLGHRGVIACLDFAPDNSNILVSVDAFDIKVWNVETEVCTHNFDYKGRWPSQYIRSMHLPPAGDKVRTCSFITSDGSLIRTRWDPQSDGITSDIVKMSGLLQVDKSAFSHCGSLLAASSHAKSGPNYPVHLTLFDMKTMKVIQTLALDDCTLGHWHNFVFSSDGKTLVFDSGYSEDIMVFQVHDLNIRRRLGENANAPRLTSAITYDSTSQVVASAGLGSYYVRLYNL